MERLVADLDSNELAPRKAAWEELADWGGAIEEDVKAALERGPSAEVQARLAAMDYPGKGAAYPMDDVHRENVRITWEAVEREPA